MDRTYSAVERASGAANDDAPDERIPDFPVECLPSVLERQVRAIAQLCGVPFGMAAPMVLATASISIGRGLRVRSLPGKITPGNLFILVCKTSGSGGSLTFKHATAPLVGLQKVLRREFETNEGSRIKAEQISLECEIESLKKLARRGGGNDGEILDQLTEATQKLEVLKKRAVKLLYLTDVTPEKLAEMLAENEETLGHIDSDAADALGILMGTRYGDGKHSGDSLWLKGYTGEPHVVFRKNGNAVHLANPCIAVLFLATPDKVQELFRNQRLTAGGLLPRFLCCDPGARPVPLDPNSVNTAHTLPSDVSQPYEAAIFEAINRYRFSTEGESDDIDMLSGARRLLIEDWNRFCKMTDGTEDTPFEARHTENAIRLAVVLHAFRHVDIEQRSEGTFGARMRGHEQLIDDQTVRNALAIRDWFNKHQEALRSSQKVAVEDAAWSKTEALLRNRGMVGITPRDLYSGRRVCGNAAAAMRLLEIWAKEGRIASFERKPEGAGRPTTAYRLTRLGRT